MIFMQILNIHSHLICIQLVKSLTLFCHVSTHKHQYHISLHADYDYMLDRIKITIL